jgi:hypothetical protein
MKTLSAIFIAMLCAGASLKCVAVTQPGAATTPSEAPPHAMNRTGDQVRTSDVGYATPQLLKLDPQSVVSQGGSLRPGPHNHHYRPPHGGPVTTGDRSDVPGRE